MKATLRQSRFSRPGNAASCLPQHATRGQSHVICGSKPTNKESKGFGSAPKVVKGPAKLPRTTEVKKLNTTLPARPEQQVTAFTSEDTWRQLDEKVNKYPMERTFTAVGAGGDDFRGAMLAAVRNILGEEQVPAEVVACRPSSKDKYLSVKIGPVTVQDADQVVAVYTLIKADGRVKFCA